MSVEELEEKLKQEFVCYYHADLIPEDWKDQNISIELARESVARLTFGMEKKEELVNLLKLLASDRAHPTNETLSEVTDIEWCIEDEDWIGYKALLEGMIRFLNE